MRAQGCVLAESTSLLLLMTINFLWYSIISPLYQLRAIWPNLMFFKLYYYYIKVFGYTYMYGRICFYAPTSVVNMYIHVTPEVLYSPENTSNPLPSLAF